jgi:hypothetical protein
MRRITTTSTTTTLAQHLRGDRGHGFACARVSASRSYTSPTGHDRLGEVYLLTGYALSACSGYAAQHAHRGAGPNMPLSPRTAGRQSCKLAYACDVRSQVRLCFTKNDSAPVQDTRGRGAPSSSACGFCNAHVHTAYSPNRQDRPAVSCDAIARIIPPRRGRER